MGLCYQFNKTRSSLSTAVAVVWLGWPVAGCCRPGAPVPGQPLPSAQVFCCAAGLHLACFPKPRCRVLAGFLPRVLFRLQMAEGIKATGVANPLVRIRARRRGCPQGQGRPARGGRPLLRGVSPREKM